MLKASFVSRMVGSVAQRDKGRLQAIHRAPLGRRLYKKVASKWPIALVCAVVQLMLFGAGDADAAVEVPAPALERRAIFDEDFSWVTPRGADETLRRIKAAGFNTLVVCVWHGRGTSWPSRLAPPEPRWEAVWFGKHDPLAYLIEKAHEQGIEVHAWFTVALRQSAILSEFYDGKGYGDGIGRSFNLHKPGFRDHIVAVIQEVANTYEIDGVNLDYIRTMGVCTSQYCIDDYRQKSGRDLVQDVGQMHQSKEAWSAISAWNRGPVDEVVERVSNGTRAVREGLLISVDSHIGKRELDLQGVDSAGWANRGLVDVIYDMNYQSDLDLGELNKKRQLLDDPRKMVILVGNYEKSILDRNRVWSRDPRKVREHMETSMAFGKGGAGAALYVYKYLSDDQISQLKLMWAGQ